jgi:hypothetical protein
MTRRIPPRMPALFFGHGNPMNALLENAYTQQWAAIGSALPKPKAILVISAHWYIQDAAVTVSTAPRTIHDFGGFPRELYNVQYPAPGDPELRRAYRKCLRPLRCGSISNGGLITGLGRCCDTFFRTQIFRSCNSASTRRVRHGFTTILDKDWRRYGKKAF